MGNMNLLSRRVIAIGLVVLILGMIIVIVGGNNSATSLQVTPPTPTNIIFPIKATNDALMTVEHKTAAARETIGSVNTSTPDTRPTGTPFYGQDARVAGAGIISGGNNQPSIWARRYWILSEWIETDGPDTLVFSGALISVSNKKPSDQGVVLVVENRNVFHPYVYDTPQQDGAVEIIDATGRQLVLRSVKSQQIFYFDVDKRQFVSALNTPTSTPSPTFNLPPVKATNEAMLRLTQQAGPLTLQPPPTITPIAPGPTRTPNYGNCPPKVAGDGLLFGHCRLAVPPIVFKYGQTSSWMKEVPGGNLNVVAGLGWVSIFPPGEVPFGSSFGNAIYIQVPNSISVEIVDAQGSVLILRSLTVTPAQLIYFDVDSRQFVPTLPLATSTIIPAPTK